MRDWQPLVALDPEAAEPLYAQIAAQVVDAILQGRLHPGAALPGTRSLADGLGVHRNTVLAAYDELYAQGWLRTERASGTFVADDVRQIPRLDGAARQRSAGCPRPSDTPRAAFGVVQDLARVAEKVPFRAVLVTPHPVSGAHR